MGLRRDGALGASVVALVAGCNALIGLDAGTTSESAGGGGSTSTASHAIASGESTASASGATASASASTGGAVSTTTATTSAMTTATATTGSGNSCDVDGMKDGAETDVDCGGPSCAPCGDGLACVVDSD